MNIILLFFALPIATIILAVVLERILRCPILTAATFFAIFLIVAFTVFNSEFLIFVIVYTILAFIAAVIAEIFFRRCNDEKDCCKWRFCNCRERNNNNNTITLSNRDVERIASQLARMQNNNSCNQNNNNNCNCNCNSNCSCNSNSTNDVATVNVTNNTTGGRTTWCCFRR